MDKACSRCGTTKAESEFFWANKQKTRRRGECKTCNLAAQKTRREQPVNKERARICDKLYREVNAVRIAARKSERYRANRVEVLKRCAEYRRKNPPKYVDRREYNREYRRRAPPNPKKQAVRMKRWLLKNAERKRFLDRLNTHRRREAPGTFTTADIAALIKAQGGLCHWCSDPIEGAYHIDHRVPIIKGGTNNPDNLVIAHPFCNLSKGGKMPWEFMPGRLL